MGSFAKEENVCSLVFGEHGDFGPHILTRLPGRISDSGEVCLMVVVVPASRRRREIMAVGIPEHKERCLLTSHATVVR